MTDYSVGYGKPPTASQFKKGQSGNPNGGSKKRRARIIDRSASDFDQALLKEAARKVAINENGVRTAITTNEAIARKLAIAAMKGEPAAQRQYLDRFQSAQEHRAAASNERFGLLVEYFVRQTAAQAGQTPSAAHDVQVWPHPGDLVLDYLHCVGEVIGPIDAKQAEPFIALVGEYRTWAARLAQLNAMAAHASGPIKDSYRYAIEAIAKLHAVIRQHMAPSFLASLDWEDTDAPAGALDIQGLGGIVNLALVSPQCDDMSYGLYELLAEAMSATETVRVRTKLNILANTTSFINRLKIERQSRDAGAVVAPTTPEFPEFFDEFANDDDSPGDGAKP